jgi:restriction system protein
MSTQLQVSYEIPDVLVGKVSVSNPYVNYNQNGTLRSVEANLSLSEMHLTSTCRVRDPHLLGAKISKTLSSWEGRYNRHVAEMDAIQSVEWVEEKNAELREELEALENILRHTLDVDDAIDWSELYRKDRFRMKPQSLVEDVDTRSLLKFNKLGRPEKVDNAAIGDEPTLDRVRANHGLLTKLFQKKKVQEDFEQQLSEWTARQQKAAKSLAESQRRYEAVKAAFEKRKQEDNDAVDAMRTRYESFDRPAIEEYNSMVLENSEYPEQFPRDYELEYQPDSLLLIVDYALPSVDSLPTIESYRFIKARRETTSKEMAKAKQKKLYESVIYQISIRTIHELFEADVINAIEAVAFNGLVTQTNPATGIEETKTILTVLANKAEFLAFDLAKVDPKATFKHMKGVSGTALIDLTPVKPLVTIEKSDRRFVDSRAISGELDETVNIAEMDWEDFEHLVRELFEKEFAAGGGEVKVTRASADGGVDAVAFDPDPLRGGKIVIQAKRYTNTVGVAAVRDLFGTVMNEGATKGILVTTSNYGHDSYTFAKDKPIALLNGQNLLYLLEKHGTKARIDILEARQKRRTD